MFGCCLCLPSWKTCFLVDWRLLVEERIANIGISQDIFGFLRFNFFLRLDIFWAFWSLQTSLLCIMVEVAGGGSVAVAIGVSDR